MPNYHPDHFSKPEILKRIAPSLLLKFLEPYREELEKRGIRLRSVEDLDHEQLAEVFMTPTIEQAVLADAIYLVDEFAPPEEMDRLLEAAEAQGIPLGRLRKSSPAEVALRLWITHRSLVERVHAENQLTRVRRFEYWYPAAGKRPRFRQPTPELRMNIESDLGDWFEKKNRGRRNRVFSFERDDGIWFLVRHGEPIRREGTMDEGKRSAVVYRPEKYDVLVYLPDTGGLGINARTKGEKDLYRRTFGLHLFGDEGIFSESGRFTLDPLRVDEADSLVCTDFASHIEWIRLREIKIFRGGGQREVEIRQADDLFQAYKDRGGEFPARSPIARARFEVKFTRAKATRRFMIEPRSNSSYTRDGDKVILEKWMTKRGFIQTVADGTS